MEVRRSPAVMHRAMSAIVERETMMVGNIELKPEANLMQRIVFRRAFGGQPFVFYSVICADCNYGLAHYIKSVGPSEFVLCIENQTPETRAIAVVYDAFRVES